MFLESRVLENHVFIENLVFLESRVLGNRVFFRVTWLFSNVIKRVTRVFQPLDNMDANTLGEWSDGDDDWIWDVDESDPWEWSDPEADDIIRNMQTGRGKKRKSNESLLPEKDFYEKESVTKHKSKKFRMTATDHTIRFNNVLNELDLIESYERTQAIFEHLLNDVTRDMNEKDHVRFVLRSDQLDTLISLPFMDVEQLTTERVFSQIERVIQSNRDFRLNDTVTVDIIHVEAPQGSGRSKRTTLNIREYLRKKGSVITIQNNDNLCLARALVVAVARIENDPSYTNLKKSNNRAQQNKAIACMKERMYLLVPAVFPKWICFRNTLPTTRSILFLEIITIVLYTHPNPPPTTTLHPFIYIYMTTITTLLPLCLVF